MGLDFTIYMTWGRLILLSLSKKRPKNQSPDSRGAGQWWLSQCTVAPKAFWKYVFFGTPCSYRNSFDWKERERQSTGFLLFRIEKYSIAMCYDQVNRRVIVGLWIGGVVELSSLVIAVSLRWRSNYPVWSSRTCPLHYITLHCPHLPLAHYRSFAPRHVPTAPGPWALVHSAGTRLPFTSSCFIQYL